MADNVTVDNGALTEVTLSSTTVSGTIAEDAALSVNPVQVGARAHSGVPTAMSADNDLVRFWLDRSGALASIPQPRQVRLTATPTITATPYSAGDQVGSLLTFTGAALATGRPFEIRNATLLDCGRVNAALELWLFIVSPTLVSADNGELELTDANVAAAIPFGVVTGAVVAVTSFTITAGNA